MVKVEISSITSTYCTDKVVKCICVGSQRFYERMCSNILRVRSVKMVEIRCLEMGAFSRFLWVTLSNRRKKLPNFLFLCSTYHEAAWRMHDVQKPSQNPWPSKWKEITQLTQGKQNTFVLLSLFLSWNCKFSQPRRSRSWPISDPVSVNRENCYVLVITAMTVLLFCNLIINFSGTMVPLAESWLWVRYNKHQCCLFRNCVKQNGYSAVVGRGGCHQSFSHHFGGH